jgi:hypothetical protein
MKYLLVFLLIFSGCKVVDSPTYVEPKIPNPKFKFHDKVVFDYGFYGECTAIIETQPYFEDYCGRDKNPQYRYFFSSIKCDGEKKSDLPYMTACESKIKLRKHSR